MKTVAIILAAGNGKRFGNTNINKTAVKISNISMIQTGIRNISSLVDKIVVVVGYKKASVINSVKSDKVIYAHQRYRLGTGHAVKIAMNKLNTLDEEPVDIIVSNGDHLFMIDRHAIRKLLNYHRVNGNDVTILTAIHDSPYALDNGRILRKQGKVASILEKSDFADKSRFVKEVNTGTYVFNYNSLSEILAKSKVIQNSELYITKVLFDLKKVGSFTVPFSKVGTGVNTQSELENFLSQVNINPRVFL